MHQSLIALPKSLRERCEVRLDRSVVVRYLVGTPVAQARHAAALIDDGATDVGVSLVALAA
jgi:hypothetical protein